MTDPHPDDFEGMTLLERLRVVVLWFVLGFGPVAIAIVAVKALQVQFPTADVALLLVAVVVPECALLYAIVVWRRRNRA